MSKENDPFAIPFMVIRNSISRHEFKIRVFNTIPRLEKTLDFLRGHYHNGIKKTRNFGILIFPVPLLPPTFHPKMVESDKIW